MVMTRARSVVRQLKIWTGMTAEFIIFLGNVIGKQSQPHTHTQTRLTAVFPGLPG